ncbi:MAG TPA: hypothetical protein VJM11_12320, partial [Nevskiaceae bacterium]|nr:hypothetical protein [Nevskiaceae bacterium]
MSASAPRGVATRYAARLLDALGAPEVSPDLADEAPEAAFARCGLLALTGPRDDAPVPCAVPVANRADAALAAFEALAGQTTGLRGSDLLTERAALMGLER